MASVDDKGRKKLDIFLRDLEAQFPPTAQQVYDCFVDVKKGDWEMWETIVPSWRPLKGQPFAKVGRDDVSCKDLILSLAILSVTCKDLIP
jgi:dynein heavy chain